VGLSRLALPALEAAGWERVKVYLVYLFGDLGWEGDGLGVGMGGRHGIGGAGGPGPGTRI
jgi:hypothetical protein